MIHVATPNLSTLRAPVHANYTPFKAFDAKLSTSYAADVSKALGRDYWSLDTGFRYYTDNGQTWIYVPAHYLTDGATVPRPFWWLLPPWGRYGQAAVLHDLLCETLTVWRYDLPASITRAEADAIFKEAMTVLGVARWKRALMYLGVRCWAKLKRIHGPVIDPGKAQYASRWAT